MLSIKSLAVSQVGKVREHNEDAIWVDDANGLWLVADGMGGHACGEVASQLAIDVVSTQLTEGGSLVSTINTVHQCILKQAEAKPEQLGMGTTLVAAQLIKTGFNIAWVGDSRVYLFNGMNNNRQLKQISVDHTFVQDMVCREVLTPEQASEHPQGNLINRSLGMTKGRFKVDEMSIRPTAAGVLLLCSDGVSDYITHKQLQGAFEQAESLEEISDLISNSVLNAEAADNFSYILIDFDVSNIIKLRNRLFSKNIF